MDVTIAKIAKEAPAKEVLSQAVKGFGLDTEGLDQALMTLNGGNELQVPLPAPKDVHLWSLQAPPTPQAFSLSDSSKEIEFEFEFACNDVLHGYTSCLFPARGLAAPRAANRSTNVMLDQILSANRSRPSDPQMLTALAGENNEAQLPAPREGAADELSGMRARRQALEMLPKGKIYLDAPVEMKVGDRRSVDARVGVNVPDDILRGHVRAGDQTAGGKLRVSHEMVATLNGPGFEIKPTTPEQQPVAEGFPTVWEWEIEARRDGAQELEATLYALVPIAEPAGARYRIDSYTQTINVSVRPQTWGEWLQSLREEINSAKAIAIALGGIGTAVLGWLGISARLRTRSPRRPRKHGTRAARSGSVSR
jgi:hypothetical protein